MFINTVQYYIHVLVYYTTLHNNAVVALNMYFINIFLSKQKISPLMRSGELYAQTIKI